MHFFLLKITFCCYTKSYYLSYLLAINSFSQIIFPHFNVSVFIILAKTLTLNLIFGSILKESGIPADNIIFFDLDSKDYNKILKPEQLEHLIQSVPDVPGTKYLFIDEVQNVNGFETVLNGFRGTNEWSIFITGSPQLLNGFHL